MLVEHAHEARVAALVRALRPPLGVGGREEEHVHPLDERPVVGVDRPPLHEPLVEAVGEPARVEAVLEPPRPVVVRRRASRSLRRPSVQYSAHSRTGGRLGLDGEDPPRSGDAFEVVLAAVGEGPARADDEVADGAADEHFARCGEAADARADVDREAADVVVGEQLAFAGVQTGADLQTELADAVADGERAADRAARPSNMASAPSPSDLTKRPRWRSTSSRTSASWLSSSDRHAPSPSWAARSVEPTMSVKSTVASTRSLTTGRRDAGQKLLDLVTRRPRPTRALPGARRTCALGMCSAT